MKVAMSFARWVDAISTRIGQVACFLIVPLITIVLLEVLMRYVFDAPTIWAWDVNVQLQATLVVLVGAYTLLSGKFVHVDIVLIRLSPKTVAKVNVATSVVVLFSVGVLLWLTAVGAWESLLKREIATTLLRPPIYPLKIIVAAGILLLLLQVVSRLIHDLATITGEK